MSILSWWYNKKIDNTALEEAREKRRENRGTLTEAVTTLDNSKDRLRELMTAMLEKRGGHDA